MHEPPTYSTQGWTGDTQYQFWVTLQQRKWCRTLAWNDNRAGQELFNKTILWLLENADTSKNIRKVGPLWKVVQKCQNVYLGHSLKKYIFWEFNLETKAIYM